MILKTLTTPQEKPLSPYRIFRESLEISVAEISKKLDISNRMVYKTEAGAVHAPTPELKNIYSGLLSRMVKPNPEYMESEDELEHFENCIEFWDRLWENYVTQSFQATNLPKPWKGKIPFRNLAPKTDDDLDHQRFNLDALYLTDANHLECTSYNVACIMKMNPHPVDKYMNKKMKNRPIQFTERMRLWDEIIREPGVVADSQAQLIKFAKERFEYV